MTTANLKQTYMSPKEYLAWEEKQLERHEYLEGIIRAMSGASITHNQIVANLTRFTGNLLESTPCRSYTSTQRVQSAKSSQYFYPDIVVTCGTPQVGQGDSILNPAALFEVLSPSTERYDRIEKFRRYQAIESLQEYFLVSQDAAIVEAFRRNPNGGWTIEIYVGLGVEIPIESTGIALSMRDIYNGLEIPDEEAIVDAQGAEA